MSDAVILQAVVIEGSGLEMAHCLLYLLACLSPDGAFIDNLACHHLTITGIRSLFETILNGSNLRVLIAVSAHTSGVEKAECGGSLDALVALDGGERIASAASDTERSDAVRIYPFIAGYEIHHSTHVVDTVLWNVKIAGQTSARTLIGSIGSDRDIAEARETLGILTGSLLLDSAVGVRYNDRGIFLFGIEIGRDGFQ